MQFIYYGKFLCNNWNNRHENKQKLQNFSIYFMLETTLPNYQKPKIEKLNIWNHYCFKVPASSDFVDKSN